MEVHTHSHTERKKWTHYLWEFLMLFLAVFCGFLAENQREQIVEYKRERQYIISLVEDLKSDTVSLPLWINLIKQLNRSEDSLMVALKSSNAIKEPDSVYKYIL